jgi:hypothetical protein
MTKFVLIGHARSGSTYFGSLLSCHQDVCMRGEILNDEKNLKKEEILPEINRQLDEGNKEFKGFKLLIEQCEVIGIDVNTLLRGFQPKYAIILWRNNILGKI